MTKGHVIDRLFNKWHTPVQLCLCSSLKCICSQNKLEEFKGCKLVLYYIHITNLIPKGGLNNVQMNVAFDRVGFLANTANVNLLILFCTAEQWLCMYM